MKQRIKEMQAKFAKHTEDHAAQVLKEIQGVVEGLTTKEAQMALDVCEQDENRAKTRLVTDPGFVEAIKEMTARKFRVRKPKGPRVRSRGVTTAIEINASTAALSEHLRRSRKQSGSSSKSGGKRLVLRDAMAMAMKAGLIDEKGEEKELTQNKKDENSNKGNKRKGVAKVKITSSDKKATKTTPTTGRKRKKSTTLLNRDDQDDDDFETVTTKKKSKKKPTSKSPGTKKPKKLPEGFQLHGRDEFVGKRTRRFFNGKPTDGTITCWSPEDKDEGDEEVYRNEMDDGDLEDLSIDDAKAAIRDFKKTKNLVTVDPKKAAKKKGTSRGNMNDCLETDQAKKLMEMGWSTARVKAFMHRKENPNAYYYRFNDLGEKQATGAWTEKEHNHFLSLIKDGVDYRWGILSIKVPGRVGYQCSNYYRLLIEKGVLSDPNYTMIEYKDAKTGNMKKS